MNVRLRPGLLAGTLLLLGVLGIAYADFADVAAKVGDVVVTVATEKGTGAGVIVNAEGYIITNTHVVGKAKQVLIKLRNDEELPGKVVKCVAKRDLCLIKVEQPHLPAAEFATSAKLKQGQTVGAVGAPLGLRNSLTSGIISSTERDIQGEKFLQVDAALNRGNSGGPIINEAGQIIGIATKVAREAENMGFAIPSDDVMTFLSEADITFQVALGDVAPGEVKDAAGPKDEEDKATKDGEKPTAKADEGEPEEEPEATPEEPEGLLARPGVLLGLAALIALVVSLLTTVLVASRMIKLSARRVEASLPPPPGTVAFPATRPVGAPTPPPPAAAEDLSDIDIELR